MKNASPFVHVAESSETAYSAQLTRSGAVIARLLNLVNLALEDFALRILRSRRARLGRPHALRGGVSRLARHRACTCARPSSVHRCCSMYNTQPLSCTIENVGALRHCHMLSRHQTTASSRPCQKGQSSGRNAVAQAFYARSIGSVLATLLLTCLGVLVKQCKAGQWRTPQSLLPLQCMGQHH